MNGRRSYRLGALALCAVLTGGAVLPGSPKDRVIQTPDPLEAVAFLAGGTWVGTGRWPDGSELHVEVRYFWGPTKHVLHFESVDLVGGVRQLLYEGMIVRDPARGRLVQWNVKPTGDVDVSEIERADTTGYEVHGAHTRSTVRRAGPDTFHWELRVPQHDVWTTILDATYTRVAGEQP
jgi:hypothetical protein